MEEVLTKNIVLTFDVEDWFHSLDELPRNWNNYERRVEYITMNILEFLSSTKSFATFFILGDVAKNHPSLIKHIHKAGHEIGSHGYEHKFIYKQSASEFRIDLKKSLECLSQITGEQVISFRAPYFSITKKSLWAFEILKEEGIKIDSSIFPVINHRYGIPGNNRLPYKLNNGIWEFPITTYKTFLGNIPFSGGVYFRFVALSVSSFLISNLLKKQEPVILYYHPWEFDPEQPIIKNIPAFLKLRHYFNLKNNFEKFSSLIGYFKTVSLKDELTKIQKNV